MSTAHYLSVAGTGVAEQVIQKSRFIGHVNSIVSEEEALLHIESVKKNHPNASTHAYAYMAGVAQNIQRFSDGKEPSGTAGMPMLDVLKMKGLTNVCAVVTRYFGGVKLGVGGLARAFSGTCADAVAQAGISAWFLTNQYTVTVSYTQWGKLEHFFKSAPYVLQNATFTEVVSVVLLARQDDEIVFTQELQGLTDGQVQIQKTDECYRAWA